MGWTPMLDMERRLTSRRFGDAHARQADAGGESGGEAVGDVAGHLLGRGVEARERLDLVEVGVAKGGDDLIERGLQGVKVAQQAVGIQGLAGDNDGDAPVVAVERLAPPGQHERMSRGEHALHAQLEHRAIVACTGLAPFFGFPAGGA